MSTITKALMTKITASANEAVASFLGAQASADTLVDVLNGKDFAGFEEVRTAWISEYEGAYYAKSGKPATDQACRTAWSRVFSLTGLEKPKTTSKNAERAAKSSSAKAEKVESLKQELAAQAKAKGVSLSEAAKLAVASTPLTPESAKTIAALADIAAKAQRVEDAQAKAASESEVLAEWLEDCAELIRAGKAAPELMKRLKSAHKAATEKAAA